MHASHTSFPLQATPCFCIEQAVLQGFSPQEILAGTDLKYDTYALLETRLSQSQEFTLYGNLLRLFGSEDVGLRLGSRMTVKDFGLVGGLLAHSIDVDHAGYLMRRFHSLSSHWVTSELMGELVPGTYVVRYRPTMELGPLSRMLIDLTVQVAQRSLIDVFGVEASHYVKDIAFGYPQPGDKNCYLREFGCPVSFGNAFTVVTFNKEVGKLRNPHRSEYSYRRFLQNCRDAVLNFSDLSWTKRVLNVLACTDHFPNVQDMASRLNCSERSLRRHLSSDGVHYSELIDNVRFERAAYLLRHSDRSLKAIANQLSYSEPGSFIRAFSRWTNVTPAEFRKVNLESKRLIVGATRNYSATSDFALKPVTPQKLLRENLPRSATLRQ